VSLTLRSRIAAVLLCAALVSLIPASSFAISGQQKAWAMFESAAKSKSVSQRATGIRALGLLQNNAHARQLAEAALDDDKPQVRAAAATALGQMHATPSIPKLQKLLGDERISVVMAAAHSLRDLKDNTSAYSVYYDVLTGERKGDGLIAQQIDTLHDPKELAMIGLEEGIGYVPFAGIGWDAWRYTHKKDPHPVRAVAATFLAHDPDPKTGEALVKAALNDKDWIVRAAALEAIAQRGDPALEDKIEMSLFDTNLHVRFTAAATVIRLAGGHKDIRKEAEKKTAMTQPSSQTAPPQPPVK
jgi:HEAT repeat protein